MRRLSVGQGTSIVCVGIEESYLGKGLESLLQRVIKGKPQICTIALRNFTGYKKIKTGKVSVRYPLSVENLCCTGKRKLLIGIQIVEGKCHFVFELFLHVLQVKFCAQLQHFRNAGRMDSAQVLFTCNFPGWMFGEEGFLMHKHIEDFDNCRWRSKDCQVCILTPALCSTKQVWIEPQNSRKLELECQDKLRTEPGEQKWRKVILP